MHRAGAQPSRRRVRRCTTKRAERYGRVPRRRSSPRCSGHSLPRGPRADHRGPAPARAPGLRFFVARRTRHLGRTVLSSPPTPT
ncbi:hypothetical protein ACFPRL_08235 [Pseudoclavibacter helvolus]